MIIRIGKKEDINEGVALIQGHLKEFKFYQNLERVEDSYFRDLFTACAEDNSAVVAIEDGSIVGVLLGLKMPNILSPRIQQLHIQLTWVKPSHRGGTAFYRMIKFLEKEFSDKCDIIIREIEETNADYSKLGYSKLETLHIKHKEIR